MALCPTCRTPQPGDAQFCPRDGTPLVAGPSGDPLLERVLGGRYRLTARLGQGGMGTVYRAVHTLMDKPVALKVLRGDLAGDSQAIGRFHREARSASRLDHEHCIRVTDFGQSEDGLLYLVMELLDGESLGAALKGGPLAPSRAATIGLAIAEALGHAHEHGVIHRDLKPDNVFLAQRRGREVVKVLDFGLAKIAGETVTGPAITKTGVVFGTPEYMAPEQASGGAPDPRTDLYALGILLYQMLTGELPFTARSFIALLTKQVEEQPVPPRERRAGIPEALEATVLRCMEKDPAARFESADALARALERFAEPRRTSSDERRASASVREVAAVAPADARPRPVGAARDRGAIDHEATDHGAIDRGAIDHGAIDHGAIDHGAIDHGAIDRAIDRGAIDRGVNDRLTPGGGSLGGNSVDGASTGADSIGAGSLASNGARSMGANSMGDGSPRAGSIGARSTTAGVARAGAPGDRPASQELAAGAVTVPLPPLAAEAAGADLARRPPAPASDLAHTVDALDDRRDDDSSDPAERAPLDAAGHRSSVDAPRRHPRDDLDAPARSPRRALLVAAAMVLAGGVAGAAWLALRPDPAPQPPLTAAPSGAHAAPSPAADPALEIRRLLDGDDLDGAERLLARERAAHDTADVQLLYAELARLRGNRLGALAHLHRATRLAPSSAEPHARLASLLAFLGQPGAACKEARAALARDPRNAAARDASAATCRERP